MVTASQKLHLHYSSPSAFSATTLTHSSCSSWQQPAALLMMWVLSENAMRVLLAEAR